LFMMMSPSNPVGVCSIWARIDSAEELSLRCHPWFQNYLRWLTSMPWDNRVCGWITWRVCLFFVHITDGREIIFKVPKASQTIFSRMTFRPNYSIQRIWASLISGYQTGSGRSKNLTTSTVRPKTRFLHSVIERITKF
jgi:hypothetical protein